MRWLVCVRWFAWSYAVLLLLLPIEGTSGGTLAGTSIGRHREIEWGCVGEGKALQREVLRLEHRLNQTMLRECAKDPASRRRVEMQSKLLRLARSMMTVVASPG